MIYQTDDAFPYDIRHFGCYFLSLLFQLESRLGIALMSHAKVMAIYDQALSSHEIEAECYLQDPQRLVDFVAPKKIKFLGKMDKDYAAKDGEFEIQCWYNPAKNFHHFVAGRDGKVTYDPIEGGSLTVRRGNMDSKRIYRTL